MACSASPQPYIYPYDSLSDADKEKYASTMNAVVSVRDGAFGQHTGFAPVFKSGESLNLEGSRESNVEYQGKGEIGAIMLDFQWNAMMQTKGYGELAKPMYDQRMWDDRGWALKAPTVRVVTDIAMAIVATVSGQQYVQYLDDMIFATVDIAGGYKTPEEVGKQLAVKAVAAGVGALGGKIGTAIVGKVADAGLQTLCNVGLAGAQAATNATAGAFINNVNLSKLGTSDWFNGAGFANTMTSADTWAGTVSAMAGAGVTGVLGQLNLGDRIALESEGDTASLAPKYSYSKIDGFNQAQISSIQTLNKLAGGLASTGVTYGMTGNATLNLANFAGVGMFEVSFGKDGFSMGLGMNGTDVSMGTIANAMGGIKNWKVANDISNACDENGMENAKLAWRTQWGYGDNAAKDQLMSFLNKGTSITKGKDGKEAETTLAGGKRVVELSGYKESMTREEQLQLALVLQHEAHRDGITGADNKAETQSAVAAHTELALKLARDPMFAHSMGNLVSGSKDLQNDVMAYLSLGKDSEAYGDYVDGTYDSSADYWKLMKNGSIAYDGFASLRDEDGNIIRSASSMGVTETQVEGGLIQILGLNKNNSVHTAAVQNVMKGAGMIMNSDGFWNKDGIVKTIIQNGQPVNIGMNLNDYNQDKEISIGMIGALYKSVRAEKDVYQGFIDNNFKTVSTYLSMTSMTDKISAEEIYGKAYSKKEQQMINYNLSHSLDISKIVPDSTITQNFEEQLTDYPIGNGILYSELHAGIDQQKIGANSIYPPDGYWFVRSAGNGLLALEQYGTGVRWRIAHLKPALVNSMDIGATFSPDTPIGSDPKTPRDK